MMVILFSSAGRRVELIECFRSAASELCLKLEVLAVDLNPPHSAACWIADRCFKVPRCTDHDFIPRILEICEKNGVDLLIPTIDTELEAYASNKDLFLEKGVKVAVSELPLVQMARNKEQTEKFLKSAGIQTPKTALLSEARRSPESWRWPLICKPRRGSSSIGVCVLSNLRDLKYQVLEEEDYIIQEYWEGREYTVNMYFDSKGKGRCFIPHLRIETRSGEVNKGITERVPILLKMANKVSSTLFGAFGALCFQAIVTPAEKAAVFEINARFGGGYPLAHRAGANFAKWILEETCGQPSTANNDWRSGVIMLRYDMSIFINK